MKHYSCDHPFTPNGGCWDDFDGAVLPFACPECRATEPPPAADPAADFRDEYDPRGLSGSRPKGLRHAPVPLDQRDVFGTPPRTRR